MFKLKATEFQDWNSKQKIPGKERSRKVSRTGRIKGPSKVVERDCGKGWLIRHWSTGFYSPYEARWSYHSGYYTHSSCGLVPWLTKNVKKDKFHGRGWVVRSASSQQPQRCIPLGPGNNRTLSNGGLNSFQITQWDVLSAQMPVVWLERVPPREASQELCRFKEQCIEVMIRICAKLL